MDSCANDCDFAHNQELGGFIEVFERKMSSTRRDQEEDQGKEDEGEKYTVKIREMFREKIREKVRETVRNKKNMYNF